MVEYEYFKIGQLNRPTTVKESGTTALATYAYDTLSRRSSVTYANGAVMTYNYDPVDSALTGFDQTATGFSLDHDFTYDKTDLLTSVTVDDPLFAHKPAANSTTSYTANGLNQYTAVDAVSVTYDTNGNLTQATLGGASHTYTYDAENRLTDAVTPANTASYAYDPAGRRSSKTVNSVTTDYLSSGSAEIAEYDRATGNLLRRYVHGPGVDERIAMVLPNGDRQFYHFNYQGSTVALTNDSGVTIETFRYNAWGESNDSATGNPFRYTGRRLDEETGLYYYRARYYSPELGRFLQTDPIGYGDGMNIYAYTGNSPLSASDPFGLCARTRASFEKTGGVAEGTSGSWAWQPGNCSKGVSHGISYFFVDIGSEAGEYLTDLIDSWGGADALIENAKAACAAGYVDCIEGFADDLIDSVDEFIDDAIDKVEDLAEELEEPACRLGNSFARQSAILSDASATLVGTGLVIAAVGAPIKGVGAAPGLALAGTGGALGLGAAALQTSAGLLQGDLDNVVNGIGTAAVGLGLGRFVRGPKPTGHRSFNQRRWDRFQGNTATVAGGTYDVLTTHPDLTPRAVDC